jgi:glycosyltransferase involved in cell wall biosynthesis
VSPTRSPLVSVIVLNWNARKHIFLCLECLFGQDYPRFTVIVIDNGSSDGSYESITDRLAKA